MWRFFRWLKYLFIKPDYDFVITNLNCYNDTSYGGNAKSYTYVAYCKNTGTFLNRLAYDYGYISSQNLVVQLNSGIFPGINRPS